MMNKKEFVVFGMGRFGKSLAIALEENGCEVMAVDIDEEKILGISDKVTYAYKADAKETEVLKELGVANYDGAIIAFGTNLEASVMAIITAKELGVPYVLAKAKDEIQGRILKRVGADCVVYPEKESGIRWAKNLIGGNFFDQFELSETHSLVELDVPTAWDGKNLCQLALREKYKINVIGIKRNGRMELEISATEPLLDTDTIVVIGNNKMIDKIREI